MRRSQDVALMRDVIHSVIGAVDTEKYIRKVYGLMLRRLFESDSE
jgi:hypothetical protein